MTRETYKIDRKKKKKKKNRGNPVSSRENSLSPFVLTIYIEPPPPPPHPRTRM